MGFVKSVFLWQFRINYTFSVSQNFILEHVTLLVSWASSECYFMFLYTLLAFFFFFIISFFVIFIYLFFFWGSIRFPQQSINKSETGIGDQKLLVDVYVNSCPEKKRNIPLKMTVVVESCYRLKPSTLQKQESGIDVFPFCGAPANVCLGSSDALLVFDREALLYSLSELTTHKNSKEQLLRKFPEKRGRVKSLFK